MKTRARLLLSGTLYVPVDVHGGEADLDGSVGDVEVFSEAKLGVGKPFETDMLKI